MQQHALIIRWLLATGLLLSVLAPSRAFLFEVGLTLPRRDWKRLSPAAAVRPALNNWVIARKIGVSCSRDDGTSRISEGSRSESEDYEMDSAGSADSDEEDGRLHPVVSMARIKTGRAKEWENRFPAARVRWDRSKSFVTQARKASDEASSGDALKADTGKERETVSKSEESQQRHSQPRAPRRNLAEVVKRKGRLAEAITAVEFLIEKGRQVNGKTFSQVMSVCVEQTRQGRCSLQDGYKVLELARSSGVAPDTFLYNALMSCAAKAAARGRAALSDGSKIIQEMKTHNVSRSIVTYNALLDVCAKAAGCQGGIPITPMTGYSVLRLLEDEGLAPNTVSFSTLMLLCARAASVGRATPRDGLMVVERMEESGVEGNEFMYNTYMDLVAKSAATGKASMGDGYAVLHKLRSAGITASVVTYNSLLDVCARAASNDRATLHEGYQVISAMKKEGLRPDTITFNTLMDVCAKQAVFSNAGVEEGLLILEAMKEEMVPRDVLTYSILLDVCAKATENGDASIQDADSILDRMREERMLNIDTVLCNSFLECAKADGSEDALLSAQHLYNRMHPKQRDAYTYTRMISLLGKMRDWKGALRILAEARDHGLKPTTYMYNAAMQACALSNRSENIPILLDSMRKDGARSDAVTRDIVKNMHSKGAQRSKGPRPWRHASDSPDAGRWHDSM